VLPYFLQNVLSLSPSPVSLSHFTADVFNDYFLSIAETLVKSQDSPDSDKQYSCSKRLVDLCQKKTRGTDSFTIPLMAVHETGKYIFEINNNKFSDLTKSAMGCLTSFAIYCRATDLYFLFVHRAECFPLRISKRKS